MATWGVPSMPFDRTASFWRKLALAAGIVALADVLLFGVRPGAGLGIFAVGVTAAVVIALPPVRRTPPSRLALLAASSLALLQVERATPLGFLLFCGVTALAALAPRARSGDDAWRWAVRLIMGGLLAVAGPFHDASVFLKARARRGRALALTAVLVGAIVPVGGGLI